MAYRRSRTVISSRDGFPTSSAASAAHSSRRSALLSRVSSCARCRCRRQSRAAPRGKDQRRWRPGLPTNAASDTVVTTFLPDQLHEVLRRGQARRELLRHGRPPPQRLQRPRHPRRPLAGSRQRPQLPRDAPRGRKTADAPAGRAAVDWITQQTVHARTGRPREPRARPPADSTATNTATRSATSSASTSTSLASPQDPPAGGFDNNGGA